MPWGGSLADRVSKRGLIVRTQIAFLSCSTVLLGLYWADLLTVWTMLAVMLVHGFVQAIDLPARLSFVPGLVAREDLSNAVALNSLLFNVARAIGPALAGFLLSAAGAEWCFIVNALTYAAIIVALAMIRLPPEPISVQPPSPHGGFRVLARQPGMLTLVLVAGLVAVGGWPLLSLLPFLADKHLGQGEAGYGTLLSAVGLGALSGALTAATFGSEVRRKVMLLGGLFFVGLALAGLAATTVLVVATGSCVMFGYGMILFFATGQIGGPARDGRRRPGKGHGRVGDDAQRRRPAGKSGFWTGCRLCGCDKRDRP